MSANHDDAMYSEIRPKEERWFTCKCGLVHEWKYAHHYGGDWTFIYLSCPTCQTGYKKEAREDELRAFPSYHRAKQIRDRMFRENPILPYDDDPAFDPSLITKEKPDA